MTAILVPYADQGCEWRRRAWEYVQAHYATNHPDWPVIVGSCGGPWSKGAALADAFARCDADLLVIADADSFVDPDVLRKAAARAEQFGWCVPHGQVKRLSQEATEAVYAGGSHRRGRLVRRTYHGPSGGGIVVLTREAWETVGGVDERYEGWGGEDVSFGWALHALVGAGSRIGAPLYHLWHPHPAPNLRGSPVSEALVAQYRAARRDPEHMRALVEERMTSLGRSS